MMVSDDGTRIILIDFGISSVTNGQTVVATQTGRTPFYSAPETNTGLFLKESDYYSLGITIYELVTGITPYQNTSIEDLQKYQQIQQIPFPDDFDADLKDLVLGLTYKDLTYRNDKSNPNRRWGYEEVKKWLNGEKQPIPGESLTTNLVSIKEIPYVFKGKSYYDFTELVITLLSHWSEGQKELLRYNLSKFFEKVHDMDKLAKTNRAIEIIEEESGLCDSIFFDLMYQLAPEIKVLYWKGYYFESVYDYGEKLLKECLERYSDNDLLETANSALFLNKLKWFSKSVGENSESYEKIIENLLSLQNREPLDLKMNALRVGYALTGKESFKIGERSFNTIEEFSTYLQNLYFTNVLKFRDFCVDNNDEITNIAKLFEDDKRKEFEKNLLAKNLNFKIGKNKEFYFRDCQEIPKYLNLLWQENRLEEFHDFTINCKEELKEIIVRNNLQLQFEQYFQNVKSYFLLDEYIFKNQESYNKFLEGLNDRARNAFLKVHKNNDVNKKDLLNDGDFCNLSLGSTVVMGNLNGPIEWIVVECNVKTALLLSKNVLFKAPFDLKGKACWKQSSLRKYLNNEFYNNSFTKDEKLKILTRNNSTNSGDTVDKVFLLSVSESNNLSQKNKIAKDLNKNDSWWWLRSRGSSVHYAANVGSDDGRNACNFGGGVRVALLLNLES